MATEYRINMKRYNGTDYDIMYPKTLIEQVTDGQKQIIVDTVSLGTSWTGAGPYTQTITVAEADANSKVDLQPDATIIQKLIDAGTTALYIVNNDGVFSAVAIGSAPTESLTIQSTITKTAAPPPHGGLIKPVLAPSSSWYKGTTAKNTITEISLVDSYTSTGSETESWDASSAGNGSVMAYIDGTKLILAGNGCGKIFANADSSYAFGGNTSSIRFSSLTTVTGMELFDTSRVTDMNNMFGACSKLTSLDVSNFNTSNVTDMHNMFNRCEGLTSLACSNWNTANVTDMHNMFGACSKLTSLDVSNFNTANVTDMRNMFYGCSKLTTIYASDRWSTANVTSSSNMFNFCSSLVGAISYDSNKVDATYANYTTGYFTYKAAPTS